MCGERFETKRFQRRVFCSNACASRHWRIEKRWQNWLATPEGAAYMAMSCEEREAMEQRAVGKYYENKQVQTSSDPT